MALIDVYSTTSPKLTAYGRIDVSFNLFDKVDYAIPFVDCSRNADGSLNTDMSVNCEGNIAHVYIFVQDPSVNGGARMAATDAYMASKRLTVAGFKIG